MGKKRPFRCFRVKRRAGHLKNRADFGGVISEKRKLGDMLEKCWKKKHSYAKVMHDGHIFHKEMLHSCRLAAG